MMAEPCRTEPISLAEAMASSLSSSQINRRLEAPAAAPARFVSERTVGAVRRSTYQPPTMERFLALAATLSLAAVGALQAFALSTLL